MDDLWIVYDSHCHHDVKRYPYTFFLTLTSSKNIDLKCMYINNIF